MIEAIACVAMLLVADNCDAATIISDVKHYDQMLVDIKVLHVAFSVMFAAEFENFFLAEQIY